jgi:hypothetical protein
MNAQKYFVDMVVPTYREFERDRLDRRRALLASLVLYHLLDYVNADTGGTKGSLSALLEKTRKRCAAFRVVEAIANGTKHVEVRGPDRFSPDHIAAVAGGTVLDHREIEQGMIREFKTERRLLWLDFKKQRHFVDIDLFVTLNYLADEFRLCGADNIELPMQLVYKDTPA